MAGDPIAQAKEACGRADFSRAEQCVQEIRGSEGDLAKAALLSSRALAGLAEPPANPGEWPPPESPGELWLRDCQQRRALLSGDGPAIADAGSGLRAGQEDAARAILRGRALLSAGRYSGAADELRPWIAREDAESHARPQHIEAQALLSLATGQQNPGEGLKHARTASICARKLKWPQLEFLAHVALARARRLNGRPYLAIRILGSLDRFVSAAWKGWIAAELVMAGARNVQEIPGAWGELTTRLSALGSSYAPGRMTDLLVDSKRAGLPAFVQADLSTLSGLLHPNNDAQSTQSFSCGHSHEIPGGFGRFSDVYSATERLTYVVHSDSRARRILGLGMHAFSHHRVLESGATSRERSCSALASLLLRRPEKVPTDAFFRELYGFDYNSKKYKSVLDTLLHRVRELLEGTALTLQRQSSQLWIEGQDQVAIPDPRCALDVTDQVLMNLTDEGPGSAKDAAERLQVPLRTTQRALKALLEDGAVQAQRVGKRIRYKVEDTSFSDPTGLETYPGRQITTGQPGN